MEEALLKRIHQLCKGDQTKAKRLIEVARNNHPHQSVLWYLQRVIADLEQEQAQYFQQRRHHSPAPSPVASPTDTWEQKVRLKQAEHSRRQTGKRPQTTTPTANSPSIPDPPPFSAPPPLAPITAAASPTPIPPPPPVPTVASPSPVEKQQPAKLHPPIKPATWNRLLVLLNGNQATAERLLASAHYRYADRSEQWLVEKVVFDLERDRH